MISERSSWQPGQILGQAASPVIQVFQFFGLQRVAAFPDAACLNHLVTRHYGCNWRGPEFIDQGDVSAHETRYYEAIIAEDNRVPTREESFHDLFNALIWLQFPRTKRLLNQLHMQDIEDAGAHPRTPRRNRVTHFDECGVVLAVPKSTLAQANTLLTQLDEHRWHDAFYTSKEKWHTVIHPVIFGHANLEMMLSPFIGLTGKWLAVVVPDEFSQSHQAQQYKMLDEALERRIHALGQFEKGALLKPLPLLGVPGWAEAQTPAFYADSNYFRPKRPAVPATRQLPLTDTDQ